MLFRHISIGMFLSCLAASIAVGQENKSSIYQPGLGGGSGSPIRLGTGPQLFIDDYLIADSQNVTRRVNQPQRDVELSNPLLTGVDDEVLAPYTTVIRDPQTGTFRIWYNSYESTESVWSELSTMESTDGIHWNRPHQVLTSPGDFDFGCSVLDEGPDCTDPSQRYKLGWYGNDGLMIATSPDGLNWTAMQSTAVINHNHDINNIFYDTLRNRYVATISSYTTDPTWSGQRRVTMQSTSNDLVNWSEPYYVLTPDDTIDSGETQFYAMQGYQIRGDLWIGMVKVLRDDLIAQGVPDGAYGMGYTTLAWSRDGEHWVRDTEPFFEPDPEVGAWDHAHAWLDYQLAVGDDGEVYLYYGGYENGHKWNRWEERCIGLVKMLQDRYVAREADADGGTLLTVPILLDGEEITINADVAGLLLARLLDLEGNPIPGFDFSDCYVIQGDSLEHELAWSGDIASLGGVPVQMEFYLADASLYGFSVSAPEPTTLGILLAGGVLGLRRRG